MRGSGEFVPILDTTSRGSKVPQRTFLRRRHGPSVGLFTQGIKTEPICDAYAKDTMRECAQDEYLPNISKRVYDTHAWQCEKWHAVCLLRAPI